MLERNIRDILNEVLSTSKVTNEDDRLDGYFETMELFKGAFGFPLYIKGHNIIAASFKLASAYMNGMKVTVKGIMDLNRNFPDVPFGFEYVEISDMLENNEFKGGVLKAFHLACWLTMASGGTLLPLASFVHILKYGNTPDFNKEMYKKLLATSMIYTGHDWIEKLVSYFELEVTKEFGLEVLRGLQADALYIVRNDPGALEAQERLEKVRAQNRAQEEQEAAAAAPAPLPPEPVEEDSEEEALAEAKRVLAEAQALHDQAAAERAAAETIAREERERLMRETASYTTTVTTYSRGGSAPKDNNVTAGDVVLAGLAIAGIAAVGYGVYQYLAGNDSDIELCETFEGRLF